jgi:hypothetical protein
VPDTSFFQFLRESNFPILAGSEKVQGANLAGYDLSGASLIKADLSGVLWDDKTKLPDNAAFKDAKNIPPDLKNLRQECWGLLLAFGLRRRLAACAGPSLSHSTRHGDQSLGHPMPPTHQTAVQDLALRPLTAADSDPGSEHPCGDGGPSGCWRIAHGPFNPFGMSLIGAAARCRTLLGRSDNSRRKSAGDGPDPERSRRMEIAPQGRPKRCRRARWNVPLIDPRMEAAAEAQQVESSE